VVGPSFILVETLVVVLLKRVAPITGFGVLFVLGVLVVSTVWGRGLAITMAVVSALALGYFRNWPDGRFAPMSPQVVVDVGVFVIAALLTNFVARLARARQIKAEGAAAELQESRDSLRALADQQAALRRVATLVAQGVEPAEVFAAVAEELGRCLNVAGAAVSRYDGDAIVLVGIAPLPAEFMHMVRFGEHFPLDGDNVYTRVLRTGLSARMDTLESATGAIAQHLRVLGVQSMVGVPIIVGDRVWGTATAGSIGHEPAPPDTEARISDFADLVATAIANAATREALQGSRDQFGELADRQAALRRVATLVARGVDPAELFKAVAEEMTHCLGAELTAVWRYESDGYARLLATNPDPDPRAPIGVRMPLEGENLLAMVLDSGRPARQDSMDICNATGPAVARAREIGIRNAVGAPIVVHGRVWGMAGIGSGRPEPPPPDTEARLGDFADLVATALANAATRDELIASRARIVAAADDARRRIERDLHDGAQQRLVSLGLEARLAEDSVPPELPSLKQQLSDIGSGLTALSSDLQQISRGIHPAILSEGGLGPALKTLARRCPVPVNLDVAVGRRLPEPVEVAAYYVMAEALTNTAKYAHATQVNACAKTKGANLCLSIQDDGIGGADIRKGSGLIGLKDRVEALGGHMQIMSPPDGGTALHIAIPVGP
jgi:signal transduction histidine kinase